MLPDGESNPGRPRDRRKSSPLDHQGYLDAKGAKETVQDNNALQYTVANSDCGFYRSLVSLLQRALEPPNSINTKMIAASAPSLKTLSHSVKFPQTPLEKLTSLFL